MAQLSLPTRLATLGVIAASAAAPALASVDNMARVTINPSFSGGSGPVDNIVQHPGHCVSTGEATGGFASSGDGTCQSDYGFIRMATRAVGSLGAVATGQFNDTITISSPGIPPGTPGTLTYTVEVRGRVLAWAGASAAYWTFRTDVGGGAYDMSHTGRVNGPGIFPPGPTGEAFGVYSVTSTFPFGQPTPLHVEYQGVSGAGNDGNGPGGCGCDDLKLWWRGISEVKLNGTPVTWSISSQSGTNWAVGSHQCGADFGSAGGVSVGDGLLDNNDFIAFITAFFNQDATADVGSAGGVIGSDGQFDNNDFIAFITMFFQGC